MVPHHPGNRGARFGVGAVGGQFKVFAERFPFVPRPQSPRDIGAAGRAVVPLLVEGGAKNRVAGFQHKVGDTRRQIQGTNRVSGHFVEVRERGMVLMVAGAFFGLLRAASVVARTRNPSPCFDKKPGLGPILRVAGGAKQFHQSEFDFGVPVGSENLPVGVGSKRVAQIVRDPAGKIEQASRSGGATVRDSGLNQVPRAVQFVPVAQIDPAVAVAVAGKVRVEVAMGPLCRFHQANRVPRRGRQARHCRRPAGRTMPLPAICTSRSP